MACQPAIELHAGSAFAPTTVAESRTLSNPPPNPCNPTRSPTRPVTMMDEGIDDNEDRVQRMGEQLANVIM